MEVTPSNSLAICRACGSAPVPHRLTYINTFLTARGNDWLQLFERLRITARVMEYMRSGVVRLEPHLIRLLHVLSGGVVDADLSHVYTERAGALWREAIRRGIVMEQLLFFGRRSDSYRAYIGGRWVYFENLPIPAPLFDGTFAWSDDKLLFKKFLKTHALPAASGVIVVDTRTARTLVESLRFPLVVKPRIGSNSRHTTPLVQTESEIIAAHQLAQQLCRDVLVEEYLSGHLCRATVVKGQLVGFLESWQPTVEGDGTHTIRELIEIKNTHRVERVGAIQLSKENEAHLERQGYTIDMILKSGTIVQVSQRPGCGSGGANRELLESVHPNVRSIVEHTASLMKAPIVGFDVILADPTSDPDTQKWGIIEANTVPYIEIHNDPLHGTPSNVAAALWDLWKD